MVVGNARALDLFAVGRWVPLECAAVDGQDLSGSHIEEVDDLAIGPANLDPVERTCVGAKAEVGLCGPLGPVAFVGMNISAL